MVDVVQFNDELSVLRYRFKLHSQFACAKRASPAIAASASTPGVGLVGFIVGRLRAARWPHHDLHSRINYLGSIPPANNLPVLLLATLTSS